MKDNDDNDEMRVAFIDSSLILGLYNECNLMKVRDHDLNYFVRSRYALPWLM
jgi:hypothetical protein